jgi:hypothetical protein
MGTASRSTTVHLFRMFSASKAKISTRVARSATMVIGRKIGRKEDSKQFEP